MAASGNEIIVSPQPRGVFLEGYISGSTPKPGTCMQVKASTEPADDGRHYYEVWTGGGTDGERDEVIVLLPDSLRGKTRDDAYADGDRCFLYIPAPGEELNMLFKNESGTDDDHPIGEKLIIDSGTGKLIVTTGDPEMEPFKNLSTKTDPAADFHNLVRFTGC